MTAVSLENAKVGDVVLFERNDDFSYEPAKIEKITKLHIVANGRKFNRHSGRLIGGSEWSRLCIHLATPQLLSKRRDALKRSRLLNAIDEAMHPRLLREMPLAKLEAIVAALETT
jgi:hypothetical protein